jgi:hypothetical protein
MDTKNTGTKNTDAERKEIESFAGDFDYVKPSEHWHPLLCHAFGYVTWRRFYSAVCRFTGDLSGVTSKALDCLWEEYDEAYARLRSDIAEWGRARTLSRNHSAERKRFEEYDKQHKAINDCALLLERLLRVHDSICAIMSFRLGDNFKGGAFKVDDSKAEESQAISE